MHLEAAPFVYSIIPMIPTYSFYYHVRSVSCVTLTALLLSSCGDGTGSSAAVSSSEPNNASAASSATTHTEGGAKKSRTPSTKQPTLSTPAPEPTLPPTPVVVGPYGQDGTQYELTFSDEFNGTSLNRNVWNDAIWYSQSNPTQNYAVEDGKLKIWPQRDASGNFFNRTIDTDYKYYQTYGFFEIEAKLPVGKGVWPAFWLFNHIGARRPEIDIMEAYPGGGPNSGWGDSNLHPVAFAATVWLDQTVKAGDKKLFTTDLSAGFHKYAVKWEPGKQTFYFDGVPFYTLNVTMSDPMYILLDLWFGSASGQPDSTTPTGKGNSYEVNYVRAWRFK